MAVTFYISRNLRVWRNVLLTGFVQLLEGTIRILTLGIISTNMEMELLVWLTCRNRAERG